MDSASFLNIISGWKLKGFAILAFAFFCFSLQAQDANNAASGQAFPFPPMLSPSQAEGTLDPVVAVLKVQVDDILQGIGDEDNISQVAETIRKYEFYMMVHEDLQLGTSTELAIETRYYESFNGTISPATTNGVGINQPSSANTGSAVFYYSGNPAEPFAYTDPVLDEIIQLLKQ